MEDIHSESGSSSSFSIGSAPSVSSASHYSDDWEEDNVINDLARDEGWEVALVWVQTEKGKEELRRQDEDGDLPLHQACFDGAPFELVEAMLEGYPEAVQVTSNGGALPLHGACGYGTDEVSPRVVRLLFGAYPEGAKVSDDDGDLPLHLAVANGAPMEILRLLTDAHPEGAAAVNRAGYLPLHILAADASPDEGEDVEKVDLLLRPLLDDETACLVRFPAFGRHGGQDRHGETPLHIAAEFDLLNLRTCVQIPRCPAYVISRVALNHPEQLRERDEHGNLPLHAVAANPNLKGGKFDLIGKLLRSYSETAAESNSEGRFPLFLAIESGKKWHEGVKALTDAAEHVVMVRDGTTGLYAFMLAATVDDPDINAVYGLLRRDPEIKQYLLR